MPRNPFNNPEARAALDRATREVAEEVVAYEQRLHNVASDTAYALGRTTAERDAAIQTNRDLAEALLSIASDAGMPDSYWHTDSRIGLACRVLGITRDEAVEREW